MPDPTATGTAAWPRKADLEFHYKTVFGIQVWGAKDERFQHRMPRRAKRLGDRLPRRTIGILVCDDDRRPLTKLLPEDTWSAGVNPRTELQAARFAGGGQRLGQ